MTDMEDIQTWDEAKAYLLEVVDVCMVHNIPRTPVVTRIPTSTKGRKELWLESKLVVEMMCPICAGVKQPTWLRGHPGPVHPLTRWPRR